MAPPSLTVTGIRRSGTIVLVDDDPLLLRCLAHTLEPLQYRIAACHCASEVLACVTSERAVVIVSDLSMPDISGFDLLLMVRKHDANLPVVFLSGVSCPSVVSKALESGAFRYLLKPVSSEVFQDTVQQAIDHYELSRSRSESGGDVSNPKGGRVSSTRP